ncbi:hypothetical protein N5C55_04780 [Pseudomonas otitidis]|uniref:hypothetical protein n=1 Tax=Metapseudomonas otitidis TaxID=319939 RepID=UPI00244D345B|nr:hypothetical protein [Pseudomonas otitidis]MDH1106679.1 hypothetical protein [Pseudomonas otitidis]MDH1157480.1 hypothetical protein [Pseudomonas otitidis]MDH1165853.1 hypothetical protein [Pseudomonas otitidis]
MNKIYFAGNHRQPCVAEYAIVIDDAGMLQRAHIVVVQSSQKGVWTSMYNTDEGRDNVLNRILRQDLSGVRVEFLTFNIILDFDDHIEGMRLPIHLSDFSYISNRNPYTSRALGGIKNILLNLTGRGRREYTILSYNIVGGCASFYTDLMDPKRERLDTEEASKLLQQAGYSRISAKAKC